MRVRMRAAAAVTLLAGHCALAAAVACGLLTALTYTLLTKPLMALPVAILVLPALYALAKGMVFLERRTTTRDVPGTLVTPEEQPALWDLVHRLATAVGVRPPDEVRIVGAVHAGISEDSRFLGAHVLRRRMFIGAPLLTSLTEKQLMAVLTHELAHRSSEDRLIRLVVSGREAVLRAGSHENIASRSQHTAARLFRGYAKLFLRVSQPLARRQEIAADCFAASVAGSSATASALRELPVIDAAWQLFAQRHLTVAWELGYLPTTFFDGFARLRTSPELREALEEIRLQQTDLERGPFDAHPSRADRIATVEALDLDAESGWGDRPALDLLTDPTPLLDASVLTTLVPEAATMHRVDWATLGHIGARARVVRDTERLLKAASAAMDQPPSLTTVLNALDAGRLADLGSGTPGNPAAGPRAHREMARGEVLPELSALVALAFSDAGQARWELDWLGRTTFVTSSRDFDMAELLAAAVGGNTDGLRGVLATSGVAADYRPAR